MHFRISSLPLCCLAILSFLILFSGDLMTFFFYPFIFGCAGSLLLHGFSLVVGSRDYSLVVVHGLPISLASLVEPKL